jgi:hypothetical protein
MLEGDGQQYQIAKLRRLLDGTHLTARQITHHTAQTLGPARIAEHYFVPRREGQLRDTAAYETCTDDSDFHVNTLLLNKTRSMMIRHQA